MPVAAGALVGVGLLIATWYATFHIALAQRADQEVLNGFLGLSRPSLDAIARRIASLCSPNPYVYLAAIPPLIAILRRRAQALAAVCAIELGANVTTQLLKPALAAQRPGTLLHGIGSIAPASWPSGHATASMALTLSLIVASPPRLRPLVAAGGAGFTVAVVFSFLLLGWHFPSDVLGGFLVSMTWTLAAVACLWSLGGRRAPAPGATARRAARGPANAPAAAGAGDRRRGGGIAEALGPAGGLLLVAAALGALVAIARPHQVVAYAATHHAFIVGAGAIGASAIVIATGVMLAVRRA